ncbi:MAG TPA: hypothetical protein PKI93_07420 [Alphaproteobacteria bacterium]|nr:hypothetical protein [Alphaproteobacteria bacterium]HNS43713.1 hypothetical protein [Alphaproteobacteria bacterium]
MSEELYRAKARLEDAKRYWRYVRCDALPRGRMALSSFSAAASYMVPSDTLKVVFGAVAVLSGASAAKEYFIRDTWHMSGLSRTLGAAKILREAKSALNNLEENNREHPASDKSELFKSPLP